MVTKHIGRENLAYIDDYSGVILMKQIGKRLWSHHMLLDQKYGACITTIVDNDSDEGVSKKTANYNHYGMP